MGAEDLKVPPEKLTNTCDPDTLGFETTDDIAPLEGTIGQERAISALELGLDIDKPGFNLFISGLPGTGRNTALRSYVERIAAGKPVPPDWSYIYGFQDPSQPVALSLPCGMIRQLKASMEELVDTCRREIPRAFEGDDYTHRIEEEMRVFQDKIKEKNAEMDERALVEGFELRSTPAGVTPVPTTNGAAHA